MNKRVFLDGKVELYGGDSRDVLKQFPDDHFSAVVCDPPYALVSITKRFGGPNAAPAKGNDAYMRASAGFMGANWDVGDTAFAVEFWAQVMRVLKPGGHVVAFSGTRTYHRLAAAIEDAGFEIRDQLAWVYGSGFPKSHDVSKAIDKAAGVKFISKPAAGVGFMGADGPGGYNVTKNQLPRSGGSTPAAREWQGWGTALKPAWEPIVLARKPLVGTVAENVLAHGTGAVNVDGCRVGDEARFNPSACSNDIYGQFEGNEINGRPAIGRWPANIIHDGSDEVVACFPSSDGGGSISNRSSPKTQGIYGAMSGEGERWAGYEDSGSAARFYYSAKADKEDRIGSKHPTVKPVDLMQWLCRLVTPPGGTVLDPFAGSGSTGEAAWREGFNCVLIEREEEYQTDIAERLRLADKGPIERKARKVKQAASAGPLFGDNDNAPPHEDRAGRSTATSPTRTHDWPDRTQAMTPEQEAAARALARSIPPTKSTPEEIAARRAARRTKNAA